MFTNLVNSIAADTILNTVITGTMLQGVLNEIIGLLPTVLPVVITFLGIRKGISFVIGMLRSA
ncbi:hypothetical protein [uncultured Eubacterium sp.]|uniref:hypothetical protein n=1 Tax=uncultured Eubacterium sp. TaxID=165185 RepID=UPI0015AF12AC|nr:hypothetical protein [uncultured Eubacterium sp.]